MDSFIGLVLLLGIIVLVCECDGLKEGEPGVCRILLPTIYMASYACPQNLSKTCVRKKYRKVFKPLCCTGWISIIAEDKCVPECKYGCKGGNCTAPDKCECEPPLTLVGHECVAPVCEPPCVSGTCVGGNSCLCDDGFHFHNETHCVPICAPGYYNNPIDGYRPANETQCEPVCDNCYNGECVAPGVCRCDAGYEMSGTTCTPVCDADCTNGKCVAPNTCSCNLGYKLNETDIFNCNPICDECGNGECVAPNSCRCKEGYAKVEGKCSPVCVEPCSHGDCVAPDVCLCHDG